MVLRFRNDEVKRDCCDFARLRRLWGPIVARRISHRLQQLEAMTTFADLAFLPFDAYEHDDGVIEVAIADDLALFIEREVEMSEGEVFMHSVNVVGLRNRSTAARNS